MRAQTVGAQYRRPAPPRSAASRGMLNELGPEPRKWVPEIGRATLFATARVLSAGPPRMVRIRSPRANCRFWFPSPGTPFPAVPGAPEPAAVIRR